MAPLPPTLSTSKSPEESSNPITGSSAVPCSCLLSPSFLRQFPFSSPSSHPKIANQARELVPKLGIFHAQIVSIVDRCVRELSSAAVDIPFLQSIMSLSDNVQGFCKVRFGDDFNASLNTNRRHPLSGHNFAAILPGDSVAGLVVANGLANFLNLYNTVLIVRLVLTWFPGAPAAIVNPLSTICDPFLNIFRGVIPPLGGTLDLSPILAFLVLNAFTSTAAALPAELPAASGTSRRQEFPFNLTSFQQKWMRRVSGRQEQVLK